MTAHLTVLALVVMSAGFGIAATRGSGTSAIPVPEVQPFFDLVGIARAGANDPTVSAQFSADLVPDPTVDDQMPNRMGVRPETSAPSADANPATPAPRELETPLPLVAANGAPVAPSAVVQPEPVAAPGALLWPVSGGSISQYFHAGHLALDIAAPAGNAVFAAAGGTVTFVGWMNNGGGNVISIDHGNGLQTVYNHLGGFAIGTGTYVAPGQIIGYVGCTGMCTGPHVHFEVIVGGVIVNPLRYL